MIHKGTLWDVDVCQLLKKAWSTVIESGIRRVQWRYHKVTFQDLQWTVTRMRWRSARRCVTPMTQEMSWICGGLRLEVWLCAPESLFAVCSFDDIPEASTKPETMCFNPFTFKTYLLRPSLESSAHTRARPISLSCSDFVLQDIITSGKSSEWSLLHAIRWEMGVAIVAGWDHRLEPNVISINMAITSCERRKQWFLMRMPWIDVKFLGATEPLCRGCITLYNMDGSSLQLNPSKGLMGFLRHWIGQHAWRSSEN